MGFLEKAVKINNSKDLINLAITTTITEELKELPPWKNLLEDYQKQPLEPEDTCAVTLINAIITHQRRYFVFTRDGVEKMVRQDKNWKSPPTFSTKNWKKYLKFLYENKIIAKVTTIEKVTIYELIQPDLLHFVPHNAEHKEAALAFASRTQLKTQNAKRAELSAPKSGENIFTLDPERREEIRAKFKFDNFTDEEIFGPGVNSKKKKDT